MTANNVVPSSHVPPKTGLCRYTKQTPSDSSDLKSQQNLKVCH